MQDGGAFHEQGHHLPDRLRYAAGRRDRRRRLCSRTAALWRQGGIDELCGWVLCRAAVGEKAVDAIGIGGDVCGIGGGDWRGF